MTSSCYSHVNDGIFLTLFNFLHLFINPSGRPGRPSPPSPVYLVWFGSRNRKPKSIPSLNSTMLAKERKSNIERISNVSSKGVAVQTVFDHCPDCLWCVTVFAQDFVAKTCKGYYRWRRKIGRYSRRIYALSGPQVLADLSILILIFCSVIVAFWNSNTLIAKLLTRSWKRVLSKHPKLSPINLVCIFRCSSSPWNPV
jgi:hypothetical protein